MNHKIRDFIREAQIAREQGLSQSDHYQDFPRALRMIRAVVTAIDHAYIVGQDIDPGELYTALTKAMEANND